MSVRRASTTSVTSSYYWQQPTSTHKRLPKAAGDFIGFPNLAARCTLDDARISTTYAASDDDFLHRGGRLSTVRMVVGEGQFENWCDLSVLVGAVGQYELHWVYKVSLILSARRFRCF